MKGPVLQALCLTVVGAIFGWICNPQSLSPRQHDERAAIPDYRATTLTAAEVLPAWRDGTAIIVDARSREEYEVGHIAGSVAANDAEGKSLLSLVRRLLAGNPQAVIVGDGTMPYQAAMLSGRLRQLGHLNVHLLEGGIQSWTAAGGQLVTGWDMKPLLPGDDE
ncbi:MAG: hypothetical protein KDB53_20035 [Planctomycetes bacterium]|nr:hypothetical protein [Planctomycetota bacterium]